MLWSLFVPVSLIGNEVRVFGNIRSIDKRSIFSRVEYVISANNLRIITREIGDLAGDDLRKLVGRRVEAVGILDYRLPEKKISDLVVREAKVTISSTSTGSMQVLYQKVSSVGMAVHEHFVYTLGNYFSQNELSLFIGMLLGTKEELSTPFYQQLQNSGLLHLVAASGYNISIVLGVSSLFIGMIFPRRISILFVILFTLLYVFIAGFQASVVRAAFMGGAGYLSICLFGGGASTKRLFSLIALLMLLFYPNWFWDVGYQLSTAATAGLLWLATPIGRIRFIGQIPSLSESLAASIATLPVIISNFGWDRVSWAGVAVNPVAELLVGPIMAVGAGVVLVGSVWPFGGKILAILGRPVIVGLINTIEFGAWLNGGLK